MIRVAITGSSGFFGSHLVTSLKKKDFNVTIFDRKKNNLLNQASLKNFLKDQDVVVHLAGVHYGTVKDIIKVNIIGTKELLDGVSKYCPNAKFIFISSFRSFNENDLFGMTKWVGSELVQDYVNRSLIKKAVILRFSSIYGPGSKPFGNSAIATFAYLIKQGKEVNIDGDGKQVRDFLFIEDAVNAVIKSIEFKLDKGVEIFDICSEKLVAINDVIRILTKFSSQKIIVKYKVLNKSLPQVSKNFQKAKKILGWSPRISLEDGLREIMK